MYNILGNWRIRVFGISALLAVLACGIGLQLSRPIRPAETPAGLRRGEVEVELLHPQTEPVGWVFGRAVGFQGADKPLLPRQSLPATFMASPTPSDSR